MEDLCPWQIRSPATYRCPVLPGAGHLLTAPTAL